MHNDFFYRNITELIPDSFSIRAPEPQENNEVTKYNFFLQLYTTGVLPVVTGDGLTDGHDLF